MKTYRITIGSVIVLEPLPTELLCLVPTKIAHLLPVFGRFLVFHQIFGVSIISFQNRIKHNKTVT